MKKLISLILTICFISGASYADDQAVYLEQNKQAPFSGYLIKEERTKELLRSERESGTYKLLNESLETSLKLQGTIIEKKDQQVKILLDQNEKLYKTVSDANTVSGWEKAAYFILGALATYGAFHLAKGAMNQ